MSTSQPTQRMHPTTRLAQPSGRRKKLIDLALPLDAINAESAREKPLPLVGGCIRLPAPSPRRQGSRRRRRLERSVTDAPSGP